MKKYIKANSDDEEYEVDVVSCAKAYFSTKLNVTEEEYMALEQFAKNGIKSELGKKGSKIYNEKIVPMCEKALKGKPVETDEGSLEVYCDGAGWMI